MELQSKCKRCEYEWTYKGAKDPEGLDYPVYASCPRCRTPLRLKKKEIVEAVN